MDGIGKGSAKAAPDEGTDEAGAGGEAPPGGAAGGGSDSAGFIASIMTTLQG